MSQSVTGAGSLNEAVTILARDAHTIVTSAAGAATLTAAQLVNGLYIVSGTPGAFALTTPTATLILAAIPEAVVGTQFEFVIDNGGDGTVTFTAGTGVTLSGTATVAAAKNRVFRGYVTATGTPAVRIVCGAALA